MGSLNEETAEHETAPMSWPVKTREMHNHHMDSTIWNDFAFRPDDILIATYAKSGTTWMQQIVAQLVFKDVEKPDNLMELSPWFDMRLPPPQVKMPAVEAQTHRRFLKTHLPVDALVYSPKAKYIYVARDGRDMLWSLYNHHVIANDMWYGLINDSPGRVGPPVPKPLSSVREYFLQWLEKDGYPFWPFWEHIRSWWEVRTLPNLLLVHFNQLKTDLPGQMKRIAEFLEIDVTEEQWPEMVERCGFSYMKANATQVVGPMSNMVFDGGAESFIYKGTNGRWKDTLTAEDIALYEATAKRELGGRVREVVGDWWCLMYPIGIG